MAEAGAKQVRVDQSRMTTQEVKLDTKFLDKGIGADGSKTKRQMWCLMNNKMSRTPMVEGNRYHQAGKLKNVENVAPRM